MVSHIYREGNECADKLANIGLSLDTFQLWDHLPLSLGHSFGRDKLGMPSFRFSSF
jgi:hypothetical protein